MLYRDAQQDVVVDRVERCREVESAEQRKPTVGDRVNKIRIDLKDCRLAGVTTTVRRLDLWQQSVFLEVTNQLAIGNSLQDL